MAVAYGNANTEVTANFGFAEGQLEVSPPANLASGDLWLITTAGLWLNPPVSFSAGITKHEEYTAATYSAAAIGYKIAGASESSVTISYPSTTGTVHAVSSRWTGADATTPLGTPVGTWAANGFSGDAGDLTISSDGAMALALLSAINLSSSFTSLTAPSGMTKVYEYLPINDKGCLAYVARNAGAYDIGSWSWTGSQSDWSTRSFEIKPGSPAPSFRAWDYSPDVQQIFHNPR